ncbi:MAG: AAA family ATPase [Pseudonocardiaceae bacterium]
MTAWPVTATGHPVPPGPDGKPDPAYRQQLAEQRAPHVQRAIAELDQEIPSPDAPPDADEPPGPGTSHLGKILARSQLAALPAVAPLIEGVMSYPAAVVMVGATGVGKTFVVLSLGCSVATGRAWLGRAVTRRRVLFVVGEGAYGLDKRIAAWEHAWNDGVPVTDDWLTVMVKPDSLDNVMTWQQLTEYATRGGYGLVVLDTFSSLAPDADETRDAARLMRRLSDLSAAIDGCAVLVHHPGWSDSGRARGGYQLEANADEVLILRDVAEGSDLFTMSRKKVKDGPDGEVHWLRRSVSHGSVIIEGSRSDDATVPLRARILAVLTGYGDIGATGRQIMDEIGVDDTAKSGFYQALRKLRDEGLVREEVTGAVKRYYIVAGQESAA